PTGRSDLDRAKEVIEHQFGLEILLKHDELRLINQELAKCQVALEQLRRCHLIPYPVTCPTPEQMLDISNGAGPALQSRAGHPVPPWAAPFGVVEGPYARHYAKWLIPDPKFDGMVPPAHAFNARHLKNAAAEGRTTRNSSDLGTGKRPVRGLAGQKLQALSSGYPQPKDKQSPCILKRSDGQTVKLICIDCHRWDFSSTQGFINHCRIAHRRDFKSHEEAAVHCGHPIDVDDAGSIVGDDQPPPAATGVTGVAAASPTSGLVHPLARREPLTEQQAYSALQSRISESLAMYKAGRHPNVNSIPAAKLPSSYTTFSGSSEAPHLSSWLQKRNFRGNLGKHVRDAKTRLDEDDELLTPDEDGEDSDSVSTSLSQNMASGVARIPVVSSVPVHAVKSSPSEPSVRASVKSRALPPQFAFANIPGLGSSVSDREEVEAPMYDDMEIDLSPNTVASNNAPSLVSDDGEYDDSDDGSSSETSESMDVEPESDVAEINIDEDEMAPAALRRRASTSVQLKKAESKHVTFVTPHVPSNPKARR
ncbi:hypothetical protein GQ53DRAFT_618514, partial [Thozetella sp. PMI_491]